MQSFRSFHFRAREKLSRKCCWCFSFPSPQLPAITFVWIKGLFSPSLPPPPAPAALALQALLVRERIQAALCLDLGCLGVGRHSGQVHFFTFRRNQAAAFIPVRGGGGGGLLIVMLHCAWRVLLRKLFNFNLLLRSHPAPAQGCGGDIIRCETD